MNYFYGIAGLLVVVVIATLLLPVSKSTIRTAYFDAKITDVWAVYTDFSSQPDWRDEVASVEFKDGSQSAWIERLKQGGIEIHLEVIESTPPNRLVLRTYSPNNFEGEYTAIFEETESGTKGTFTESSTSSGYIPKLMRFLFVNQEKIIDKYSDDARAEIQRRQNKQLRSATN